MWKQILLALVAGLILGSCAAVSNPVERPIIIDWVDFIRLNGKPYESIQTAVIADPALVEEPIGEVTFRVDGNVTNPDYRPQDGDAAFWDPGTRIHAVQGYPNHAVVAVPDDHAINGYRLYFQADERAPYRWHFKDVPQDRVRQAEIYISDAKGTWTRLASVDQPQEVKRLLDLLNQGTASPDYQPDTSKGDPQRYAVVLHTADPVAYQYALFDDGSKVYWHPWDTAVLPDEIREYLTP